MIALSSGEAELYSLVKAASQAKGSCSLLDDFGLATSISAHADSTAAISIASRRGLGKTRHIEVQNLWIQQSVHKKELAVKKIVTKDNPADVLTKGFKRELIDKHVEFLGETICRDRASTALSIHWMSRPNNFQKEMWPKAQHIANGAEGLEPKWEVKRKPLRPIREAS